jgi:predicted sulfurtransferase
MHAGFAPALLAITLFQPQGTPPAPNPQRQIVIPPDTPPPAGEELRVKPDDIDALLADGKVVLLDVREPWELEENGTLEGSINIPLGQLEKRLAELPKDKAILTA